MKKNLIAIVATACILLVGCSKDPENGPVSTTIDQQAIAASAAYGKRMAEIEAEQRVKSKDKEGEDAKSKEKENRNTEAKERMFHDISSGNILEALKKVAGSDVSRGTVTLSGVATNLTYNLLDNYGVRFSEDTHGVSSAFWL